MLSGDGDSVCTLQVGSVMGMTVAAPLLVAIYPISTSLAAVERDLTALADRGFLIPPENDACWTFAQVILTAF